MATFIGISVFGLGLSYLIADIGNLETVTVTDSNGAIRSATFTTLDSGEFTGTDKPANPETDSFIINTGSRLVHNSFIEMIGLYRLGTCSSATGYFVYGTSRNNLDNRTINYTLTETSGVLAPFAVDLEPETRYYFAPVLEACETLSIGSIRTTLTKPAPAAIAGTSLVSPSVDTTQTPIATEQPMLTPAATEAATLQVDFDNGTNIIHPNDRITYIGSIINLGTKTVTGGEIIITLPSEVRFIDSNTGIYRADEHIIQAEITSLDPDQIMQISVETEADPNANDGDLVTGEITVITGNTSVRAFDYDEYRNSAELLPASISRISNNNYTWGIAALLLLLVIVVVSGRRLVTYTTRNLSNTKDNTETYYRGAPYTEGDTEIYPYTPTENSNPQTNKEE